MLTICDISSEIRVATEVCRQQNQCHGYFDLCERTPSVDISVTCHMADNLSYRIADNLFNSVKLDFLLTCEHKFLSISITIK